MRFVDKVCVVTGGGSGIGKAACKRFAQEGGKVVVVDSNEQHGNDTVEEIDQAEGKAVFTRCDVGNPDNIKATIKAIIDKWNKIDVLVNNAAMMTFQAIAELPDDDFDKVINVNLRSVFLFCKYSVPHMPQGSAIVNVSSVHAFQTTRNVVPYATSKGGMEAFTRGFSEELVASNIRINCVAPGAVDTPMLWNNPNVKSGVEKVQGAIGKPEDIAAAICFLASDEARFITGTNLTADGGRLDILSLEQDRMMQFMFATGIENSYPTIEWKGKTIRQDEMAKTKHYERWGDDFRLLRELDIEYLRYGPPYFSVHTGPGKYDWGFTDETFNALREQKVTPIVDLCHFGVPGWVGNFQNPDWPTLFAEFAQAFARRFPWVRFYTPVNEIFIAATFSAQFGWWNECLQTDRAFVTALKHLCQANMLAMHAILKERPDAIFIQSESTQYFHPKGPHCENAARRYNEKRFLSFDLTYGHHVNATIYEYLLDNGMTRDEYHWFLQHHMRSRCVMGNDYYVTNENLVHADGSTSLAGEIFGYYPITHQYFSRYLLPVMHTETNNLGGSDAVQWLIKEWANVQRLRQDGVPIIGFTWYSLQDQVDWDTGLRENNGTVNPIGLCNLDRNINPVGFAYKGLIGEWREALIGESSVLGISS